MREERKKKRNKVAREEREKRKKKKIKPYAILFYTVPKLRRYYNMFQNFDTFNTPYDALFLVCQMPNIFGIWHT